MHWYTKRPRHVILAFRQSCILAATGPMDICVTPTMASLQRGLTMRERDWAWFTYTKAAMGTSWAWFSVILRDSEKSKNWVCINGFKGIRITKTPLQDFACPMARTKKAPEEVEAIWWENLKQKFPGGFNHDRHRYQKIYLWIELGSFEHILQKPFLIPSPSWGPLQMLMHRWQHLPQHPKLGRLKQRRMLWKVKVNRCWPNRMLTQKWAKLWQLLVVGDRVSKNLKQCWNCKNHHLVVHSLYPANRCWNCGESSNYHYCIRIYIYICCNNIYIYAIYISQIYNIMGNILYIYCPWLSKAYVACSKSSASVHRPQALSSRLVKSHTTKTGT